MTDGRLKDCNESFQETVMLEKSKRPVFRSMLSSSRMPSILSLRRGIKVTHTADDDEPLDVASGANADSMTAVD